MTPQDIVNYGFAIGYAIGAIVLIVSLAIMAVIAVLRMFFG